MVRTNGEWRGGCAQFLPAGNRERVGPDPLDLRAEAHQEPGEILHMGLAGGIAQHRATLRGDSGHQRVLRAGDARLIQEHVRPGEGLRLEPVAVPDLHHRAQRLERQKVRIHPAPSDHVAAGRRQRHTPESGQHRTGEQNRGADPGAQRGIELTRLRGTRVDDYRVGRRPFDLRAQMR